MKKKIKLNAGGIFQHQPKMSIVLATSDYWVSFHVDAFRNCLKMRTIRCVHCQIIYAQIMS